MEQELPPANVLVVGDVARCHGGIVQAAAFDFDDVELAQRSSVDRRVEHRGILNPALVLDEHFAGNVVPVRETIARVLVGHREDLVHRLPGPFPQRCPPPSAHSAEGGIACRQ